MCIYVQYNYGFMHASQYREHIIKYYVHTSNMSTLCILIYIQSVCTVYWGRFWARYHTARCFLCGSVIILYVVNLYKCSLPTGHSQVLCPVRASQSPPIWDLSCVEQLCSVSCSAIMLFLWRSLLGTLSAMRHIRRIVFHHINIFTTFLWTLHCLLSLMAEEWQGST